MAPDRPDRYDEARAAFQWAIPRQFNMAQAILARNDPDALAVLDVGADMQATPYTYGMLRDLAARVCHRLAALGVGPGDRVGVLLSQGMECAVAHLGAWALGAITVPLFVLFGDDALRFRLSDSGAKVVITDGEQWARLRPLLDELPALTAVLLTDGSDDDPRTVPWSSLKDASSRWEPAPTEAETPAIIIYTSGTTGAPKGALHAHRVLLGHLPGVVLPHQALPKPQDRLWTPADWAWIGGLFDVLMPGLYLGVPVVAFRPRKFDPVQALDLMARFAVRNVFLPPTALKMLRMATDRPWPGVALRTLASGGESLGNSMGEWIRQVFGVEAAEFYGQTEANLLVSNAPHLFPPRLGSMGRPVFGHDVRIQDEEGQDVPPGQVGEITVGLPDPVAFLGYWNQPEATAAKTRGQRVRTGDLAWADEEGYFYFVGRADDVINTAGYRVGPGEIEDVILTHPAVAMAAVIGKPDPVRGEIIKAFVVPQGPVPDPHRLAGEIQDLVRRRLGAHEYPREVEFVDSLPLTTTGKIQRRVLREREGAGGRSG